MLLTSQNHSTNLIYHLHGPKKRAPPELGQKSKITNICVGVYQKFFSPTFLDVFLDVESDKKKTFDFWQFFDRDIAVFLILTSIFNPIFLETGTFLGRTVTCVEFVSKNALKWAKVVFFEKKSPNNLNLVNYFSPSSRCLVIDENFLKNRLNMVYFVQNFSLIIFLVFKEYNLVPPRIN